MHRIERADAGVVHAAALMASGDVDSGLVEFEQSIQVLINAGAKGKAAATLRELAVIHQSMGDFSAALECSQRALSVLGVAPTYTPAALLAPAAAAERG